MQNPANKIFPQQTSFETCGGMHLIVKSMRISFRSISKKRSIRSTPALAFSSPSENEFSPEIHLYYKFIEQGRKCSRPCQWINKGVRQGDPLSFYLFLLAVEPLVAAINNDTRIERLGKGRKRNVKCPSYADDLTLTLVGSPSVCLAFEITQRFSEATGLKLNLEKTQGMMVGSSCADDRLPLINWQNQSIKILGYQIGNVNPRTIWHDSLEGLKKQKLVINVPFQTWQAKSLLAKSKLLPQNTYNAHTYPLDTTSRRLIEIEFLNY